MSIALNIGVYYSCWHAFAQYHVFVFSYHKCQNKSYQQLLTKRTLQKVLIYASLAVMHRKTSNKFSHKKKNEKKYLIFLKVIAACNSNHWEDLIMQLGGQKL